MVRRLLTTGAGAGLVAAIAIATVWSGGQIPDVTPSAPVPAATPLLLTSQQVAKAYADLPVSFVENRGQTDARVRYYAHIYSTFVGGSNMEFGNRLAVDANGNAYVTGTTKSSNFPTTGGSFDRSQNIPPNCPRCATDVTDGFVFKLNAAGSALSYSTYLGGTEYEAPRGIAVDGSGNAYVTGESLSSDFPTRAGGSTRLARPHRTFPGWRQ